MRQAMIRAMLLAACSALASAQLINAGGATFPFPIYSKWFDEYNRKFPSIHINYQSQGSGFGVQQVTAGLVDFGASDGPMTDDEIRNFRAKRGFGILHFPTVLGADVPIYNIPGITEQINFTPDALAGIFLGRITRWNDAAIAAPNPGVKLPPNPIIVVHRSEASGTTYIWTDYLSSVSREWETKIGRGRSVNWPVGLGGKGNEGVAGQVKQTRFSIGYVELTFAIQTKTLFGKVKNLAGEFVSANLDSVRAAAASAVREMPEDFRISIVNAPGKASCPISSFSWLLIPERIPDPRKKKIVTDFLRWMLGDGQAMAESLSYARLPKPVVEKGLGAVARIQ